MGKLAYVVFIMLIAVGGGMFFARLHVANRQFCAMADAAADVLAYGDIQPGRDKDYWGNKFQFDSHTEKACRIVTVYSAGADGRWAGGDDWERTERDYNKSYLAGQYVGVKAKEACAGVFEGLKKKSKFQE